LVEPPVWNFGGGTALFVHLNHRISYDVDIFVRSSDVVADLAPNRNATTKRLLGERKYDYPGNYLKLRMDEGEIDFIVASYRTREQPFFEWEFDGRIVKIETPWETIAKKIFFRPSNFKVRDMFDMIAVMARHPDKLADALTEVADKIPLLYDRIRLMAPYYEMEAARDINPTESGARFMTSTVPTDLLTFLKGHILG